MWRRLMGVLVAAAALDAQPAAVIAKLDGKATVTNALQRSQPAHSLDWLPAGTVLETSPGSRLVLAFANGQRCEIGSGAKVSITAEGPANATGPLRELEKLPPMPKLPVVTLEARAGAMGGIRVRENGVRLLFPHTRLSTLPEHTVLRLDRGDSTASYKIEVTDEAGNVFYQTETSASKVSVPAGVLKPGQFYVWRIRGAGGEVLGQTTFTTASAETIARRAAFKTALSESDGELLAVVDAQLGLLEEAGDELRAAIAHSDAARKLLEVVESAMR